MKKYSIGIDFGTLEVRAMLVDEEGNCIREAHSSYKHGVMTESLCEGIPLPEGFALQHPEDYVISLGNVLQNISSCEKSKMNEVVGIGIDFTQCTMMPIDAEGRPLCSVNGFSNNPHAYVKLWKHHGAEKQAEKMTAVAQQREEKFLLFYGGRIYAESMFPKIYEVYEKSPKVFEAADRFVELADWIPQYLTGSEKRSCSIAGCAALWSPSRGYPSEEYFENVETGSGKAIIRKMRGELVEIGKPIGFLSKERALQYGLKPGIPVASGVGDCQAAYIASALKEKHILLSVMGTSSCDMLINEKELPIPGIYGVSWGSMIPGQFGYEAGQATMGDLLTWFVNNCVSYKYILEAKKRRISIFDYLGILVSHYEPGETGLLALDWWNGNRSVLLDTELSGMILGMNMNTKCEEIYYALIESLAFGKRRIVEQFESWGISIEKVYVTGGVANKNPFLMQLFADVLGIPIGISETENGSCLGSAIYGMNLGMKDLDLLGVASKMGRGPAKIYSPHEKKKAKYDKLYKEYCILYQYFGKENMVMKRLKYFSRRVNE